MTELLYQDGRRNWRPSSDYRLVPTDGAFAASPRTDCIVEGCDVPVMWEGQDCIPHMEARYAILNTPITDVPDEAQVQRAAAREAREKDPLHAEAVEYAKHYSGSFDFMQQMRLKVEAIKFRGFSEKMVAAIIRCRDAETKQKVERERQQTGIDLVAALGPGRTRAAVDNDSGGVSFLVIDVPAADHAKWAGWAFVKQQQGPNEDAQRLGSQRPGESYSGKWANLVQRICDDPLEAIRRYGLELGRCGRCDKALTNDESRERGIGPVCEGKLNEAAWM